MTTLPKPNDGSRPSGLQLGRYLTEELDSEQTAAVEAAIESSPTAQERLGQLERSEAPPLDLDALRVRAASVEDDTQVQRPAANRSWALWLTAGLVLAAAVLLATIQPMENPGVRMKSGEALSVFVDGDVDRPYQGEALGEGAELGFAVTGAGHSGVVLLSIDAAGALSVYFPAHGEAPLALDERGLVPLPETLVLDDAPGPEVFVAVYDQPVAAARAAALHAFTKGGLHGLVSWAGNTDGVVVQVIERR